MNVQQQSAGQQSDHPCDKDTFPRVTTAILEIHTDEVWNLQWSHSGKFLATASRDKSAIIWYIGCDGDLLSTRAYGAQYILRHEWPVACVAWSLDDTILLTAVETCIRMWNTRTGTCTGVLEALDTQVFTSLAWLPDGTSFVSGDLDGKIILWNIDGTQRGTYDRTPVRVTDLAITPDFTRLVAVGMSSTLPAPTNGTGVTEGLVTMHGLPTKQLEASIRLEGELTSVKISHDSRYALINCAPSSIGNAPCEIRLWDLNSAQIVRRYTGHKQSRHVIRSCFGGVDDNFIVSGSEDGKVYVWHRDTGVLLEALQGHAAGSVNAVAWNPRNTRMFASCSDDRTIRIWEVPPSMPVKPAAVGE